MKRFRAGFALPTVLIASLVMMMVLMTALTASSSIKVVLDDQHYTNLAKLAAESGLAVAYDCIVQNDNSMPWVDAGQSLTSATDCDGNALPSGVSPHIIDESELRTRFEVTYAAIDGSSYMVTVRGITERLRASDGVVWSRYTHVLNGNSSSTQTVATKIATGLEMTCAIIKGETWCWGGGDDGKLGNGGTADSDVPSKVTRAPGVLEGKTDTDVVVGYNNACAVSDGEAYCWGWNEYGQLGDGTTTDRLAPVPVSKTSVGLQGKTVKQIALGTYHGCALTTEPKVYCWGYDRFGILGTGSAGSGSIQTTPVPVTTSGTYGIGATALTNIVSSYLQMTTCAYGEGRLYCWGRNDSGQLANGDSGSGKYSASPRQIRGALASRTVTDASIDGYTVSGAARMHVCAVASGKAYCWGNNGYGKLGTGDSSSYITPTAVDTSSGLGTKTVTGIATSNRGGCVLAEGAVYCWGSNEEGQLGINSFSPSSTNQPTTVYTGTADGYGLGSQEVTMLAGGGNRMCAITTSAYCWGTNDSYQIGDGTTTDRNRPTPAHYLQGLSEPIYF